MSAKLALFDIDGTLLQTSDVDDACYQEAIRLEWGVTGVSTDWGAYEHSTDNAIATEISRVHRGRDATDDELAKLRERFFQLVRSEARRDPALFRETPGARAMLAALPTHGWRVGIATGGWTPTAMLKLAEAGIGLDGIPAAFACDARPREEIMQCAIDRAEASMNMHFDRVVYVGDGVWDVRAAQRIGLGFVGIAHGDRIRLLREAGAARIVSNFSDLDGFLIALDRELQAAKPRTRPRGSSLA